MDKFFYCCNVRNTQEYKNKKKPFLKPYSDINDTRFEWLQDVFLKYYPDWKTNIDSRPGNFTANAKSKMFLSWQTYEGLQITTLSLIECVKYLLRAGIPYILTEVFCQDDLENNFGKQRAIGCRRDNPTVRDVGYNENTIKSQFSILPLGGNVRNRKDKWVNIDATPLPKRKKSSDM